jgi:hypothetical protein
MLNKSAEVSALQDFATQGMGLGGYLSTWKFGDENDSLRELPFVIRLRIIRIPNTSWTRHLDCSLFSQKGTFSSELFLKSTYMTVMFGQDDMTQTLSYFFQAKPSAQRNHKHRCLRCNFSVNTDTKRDSRILRSAWKYFLLSYVEAFAPIGFSTNRLAI